MDRKRKTDAQTQVGAHTLTSEIYFSIQILDLRGQAQLEQVQTGGVQKQKQKQTIKCTGQ